MATLRTADRWVPLLKTEARQWKVPVAPLAPLTANHVGMILDRSLWLETPIDGWIAAYRLADQDGVPIVAELRLFPNHRPPVIRFRAGAKPRGDRAHVAPPGEWSGTYGAVTPVPRGGVTAHLLRRIQMRAIQGALRSILAAFDRREDAAELRDTFHLPPRPAPLPRQQPRLGRPGRSEQDMARMAACYERAWLSGRPPLKAVAKRFHLTDVQARDVIYRCRKRGLLGKAPQKTGQPGGVLTEHARALLRK